MRIVLTYLLLLTFFSAQAQEKVRKIVKEYSRGEGPTHLNNGLGSLNTEIHYDKQGRIIKKIRFAGYSYKSSEITTRYYLGSKPKTITEINYPKGYWPGSTDFQRLPENHPNRKPDTSFQQHIYKDTLLLKTINFKNGNMSNWGEYTYNEAGYEIEMEGFNARDSSRTYWLKTSRDLYNRPVKIQELYPDSSNKYTETRTYNKKGRVEMKEYTSRHQTYHVTTKFTYNSDGLKTKEIHETLSPEDRQKMRTLVFDYNSKGLLIKEGGLDSLGKVEWQKVHTYNSSRQKIKTEFQECTYFYTYNKKGDLISSRFEDSRSTAESKKQFIYKNGLLQKTEHYNRKELINYTQNYYSKSGYLIRQEPMPVEGKEALDWIKYFDYNEKGQQIRMNHKRQSYNRIYTGIITINNGTQKSEQKPDPYKDYVDQYTYFTYDKEGRKVNQYNQGGEMTRITPMGEGKYGIYQHNQDPFGMPSRSVQMLDRLDTVKIETRGELKIVTLKIDYLSSPHHRSYGMLKHFHKNLIREETFNAKGELIALKEITKDGILLFSSVEDETKSLNTHNAFKRSKSELFSYGRYAFDKISTTYYSAEGLVTRITNTVKDTTEFIYDNGQLSREIKKYGNGYYSLTSYDYDKNGFKTMERIYTEDGTENHRLRFENDGKHIISEQRFNVRPNSETLYKITYVNH